MKLFLVLLVISCVFPGIGTMLWNGMISLAPIAEACSVILTMIN